MLNKTHIGDCRKLLADFAAAGIRAQTCVTSPPYFGLRDYGHPGQIGLEPTPDEYVAQLVDVFRSVRRVLRDDGTLWLNLGDSYFSPIKGSGESDPVNSPLQARKGLDNAQAFTPHRIRAGSTGCKPKDLIGIPWRVAFALQADGWYLRQDIIWHKPNPMPESVRDRCTKAHEYLFLLAKSERYYFDIDAIKEPATYGAPNSPASIASPYGQGFTRRARVIGVGKNARPRKAVPNIGATRKALRSATENRHRALTTGGQSMQAHPNGMRHKRSVWTVATTPFSGAHFATFPRKLVEPCILAGSRPGDIVLDPFMGSGTTAQVATDLGRQFIGCELNPKYVELHELRRTTIGMAI